MVDQELVEMIQRSVSEWNQWRSNCYGYEPDLSQVGQIFPARSSALRTSPLARFVTFEVWTW